MELKNKVAIVTGGAQGLGRAYSESLLKKGATVCICDVNREVADSTLKTWKKTYGENKAILLLCDVTNHDQFEAVFKTVKERLGGVDIVVNNAGVGGESDSEWRRTISINLIGVIDGTRLAAEYMDKQNGGRGGQIINISSTAGLTPIFYTPVYCATKYGVVGFTRSCAANPQVKSTGIRYSCFCPAYTDTSLLNRAFDQSEPPSLEKSSMAQMIGNTGVNTVESVVKAFDILIKDEDNNGVVMAISVQKGIEYRHGKLRKVNKL